MTTIQMRGKGSLTLPVTIRDKYGMDEGDVFTLIDMGDGSVMLTPHLSEVNRLGERIAKELDKSDLSIDDFLKQLDEEREAYYKERYVKS